VFAFQTMFPAQCPPLDEWLFSFLYRALLPQEEGLDEGEGALCLGCCQPLVLLGIRQKYIFCTAAIRAFKFAQWAGMLQHAGLGDL
jgi:hypothetical protein